MKRDPTPSARQPSSTNEKANASGTREDGDSPTPTPELLARLASHLRTDRSRAKAAASRRGAKLHKSHQPKLVAIEREEAAPLWDQATPDPASRSAPPKWRGVFLLLLGTGLLAAGWIAYTAFEAVRRAREEAAIIEPPSAQEHEPAARLSGNLVQNAQKAMDAFLKADSVEAILATVREPERVAPFLQQYYAKHDLRAEGLESLILLARQRRHGMEYYVAKAVTTVGEEENFVLFCNSTEQFVVDWETFVGYNSQSWDALMTRRPEHAVLLRAYVRRGEYYNYGFQDHRRYTCVELLEPRGEAVLFGYVDGATVNGMYLTRRLAHAEREVPAMLEVTFPKNPVSRNQVSITRFLRFSWITPPTETTND